MLLDAVFGEPPEALHPTVMMGLVISAFEKRALRIVGPRSRRLAGIVLAVSVPSLVFVTTRKILGGVPRKPRWMIGAALLSTTLSMRGLGGAAGDVEHALREGRLEGARTRLGHLVGRDTEDLSESEVCRAAVESVAENTSDGVMAPMFYGALFGAPGQPHHATTPDAAEADIVAVLRHIATNVRRRAILLVVTDEHTISDEMAAVLRRLTIQHEVLVAGIDDLDPTTAVADGAPTVDIDTVSALPGWLSGDTALQAQYAEMAAAEEHGLRGTLDRLGIAYQRVHDDATAIGAVFHLLERHRHARR
jgi:hypothetical protein